MLPSKFFAFSNLFFSVSFIPFEVLVFDVKNFSKSLRLSRNSSIDISSETFARSTPFIVLDLPLYSYRNGAPLFDSIYRLYASERFLSDASRFSTRRFTARAYVFPVLRRDFFENPFISSQSRE